MAERIIESDRDVAEGVRFIAQAEPRFAHAAELAGALPLRRRGEGFEPLLDILVSQQISVAAADAIWARLKAAGLHREAGALTACDEDFRACGLSRQKTAYAKALASSGIDYAALCRLPDNEVVAQLTAVKGIGRWTAEIYMMFSLGRADVFAAGDLALQEAARILFSMDARPTEGELRQIAEGWSPWRGVAARLLWAYYRCVREREGVR